MVLLGFNCFSYALMFILFGSCLHNCNAHRLLDRVCVCACTSCYWPPSIGDWRFVFWIYDVFGNVIWCIFTLMLMHTTCITYVCSRNERLNPSQMHATKECIWQKYIRTQWTRETNERMTEQKKASELQTVDVSEACWRRMRWTAYTMYNTSINHNVHRKKWICMKVNKCSIEMQPNGE